MAPDMAMDTGIFQESGKFGKLKILKNFRVYAG
jgi:hypothetical protein